MVATRGRGHAHQAPHRHLPLQRSPLVLRPSRRRCPKRPSWNRSLSGRPMRRWPRCHRLPRHHKRHRPRHQRCRLRRLRRLRRRPLHATRQRAPMGCSTVAQSTASARSTSRPGRRRGLRANLLKHLCVVCGSECGSARGRAGFGCPQLAGGEALSSHAAGRREASIESFKHSTPLLTCLMCADL